jgi:uncharacterized protein (DUF2147 family)
MRSKTGVAAGLATGLAVALTLAAAAAGAARAAAAPESYGIWRNPKDSVHVEVKPCGAATCGVVVWANDKAKADSRRGGTEALVGLTLFRNFVRGRDGLWRGKVFVPDLNRTFSGTAEVLDPKTIRAKGCAFAGLACKSQDWKRIDAG